VQLSHHLAAGGLVGEKVVLRGKLKTVGIAGGTKAWEKGRVVLVQYVDSKAVYSSPHVLVALDCTHDWAEYELVIPILPKASEVRVGLQLNHCTGELQAKELSLFRVQENPVYSNVRWVVLAVWTLFMGWVFVPEVVRSGEGRKLSVFAVLVIIAIVIGTTIPGSLKNEVKFEVVSQAKVYADGVIDYGGSAFGDLAADLKAQKWLSIDITKISHFLLFAVLAGLLYALRGRGAGWRTMVDIGILACGTEFMQLFIDGRSGLVGDVVIDLAGAGFAVVVLGGRGKR
jgi:hypothetical protein